MERFVSLVRVAKKYVLDARVLYVLAGIVVSLVAHELVHVVMHLGSINSVHLFPDLKTIVAINVDFNEGHSLNVEEAIAYSVTIVIQLITIIDAFQIHDSRDRKTAEQLLFPSTDTLAEHESNLLYSAVFK